MNEKELHALEQKAKDIRRHIVKIVAATKTSHIGSMLSWTDIGVYLFYKEINFTKENYAGTNRDLFVLSKGHASLALYSILHDKGLLSNEELYSYYLDGSKLIGHLSHKVKGVDYSTGSLGHGFSASIGMALANRMDKNNHRVFCVIGDGECNEGSVWEAMVFLSSQELPNFVVIVDANKLQGNNFCSKNFSEEHLIAMLKGTGLNFYEIDGNHYIELEKAFNAVRACKNKKAHIIFAHTIKGKGISYMENRLEWHYKNPNEEQLKIALEELK